MSWNRHIVYHGASGSNDTVRATGLINRKPRFSDPQETKKPELIDIKFDMGGYIETLPHMQNLVPLPHGGGATYA